MNDWKNGYLNEGNDQICEINSQRRMYLSKAIITLNSRFKLHRNHTKPDAGWLPAGGS